MSNSQIFTIFFLLSCRCRSACSSSLTYMTLNFHSVTMSSTLEQPVRHTHIRFIVLLRIFEARVPLKPPTKPEIPNSITIWFCLFSLPSTPFLRAAHPLPSEKNLSHVIVITLGSAWEYSNSFNTRERRPSVPQETSTVMQKNENIFCIYKCRAQMFSTRQQQRERVDGTRGKRMSEKSFPTVIENAKMEWNPKKSGHIPLWW